MQNFSDTLQWLAAGGSVAVVAWFASWLLEDFAWWQAVRPQGKKLLILALAIAIGLLAQFFRQNEAALAAVRPYLDTAVLVILAWIATQIAHKADGQERPR
jgi:predicted tellurium resistance membrane protein TerC